MRKIPPKLLAEILADPYYKRCARRKDSGCDGRITFEHAIIYKGQQLNRKWAIIPICEYHHAVNKHQDGGDLQKEKNVWIALNRATAIEIDEISKAVDYRYKLRYLNGKYGAFSP